MSMMTEFDVSCSWELLNGRELKDAIHVISSTELENESGFNLMDVVSAEKCLQLKRSTDDASSLELTFTQPQTFQIIKISVICEARHIEMYTHRDEYVTTTDSVLIDADVDDFAAYRSEINLTKPLNSCKLKFVSLRCADSMWLYGMSFHVQQNSSEETERCEVGSMKMSEIVTRLQEDGLQMSEGAKRLADLLKTHGSKARNVPAYLSMLMGIMNSGKPPPKINLTENMNLPIENGQIKEDLKKEVDSSRRVKEPTIKPDQMVLLKSIVDKAVEQLENRLWEKINNRMEIQEQRYMCKLDEILQRLTLNQ